MSIGFCTPLNTGKFVVKHLRYLADLTAVDDIILSLLAESDFASFERRGTAARPLDKLAVFCGLDKLVNA